MANEAKPIKTYCMDRTRGRLLHLLFALLFLFIGFAVSVFTVTVLQEDKTAWDYTDYISLIFGIIISIGSLAVAVYEGYTSIRDAFFPEKSRLAKSIRSQLPSPEAAPDVETLFSMVDRDISENGVWFDRVAVGKEWVFGDEVSYIPRIRAVFGRDEIQRHRTGKSVQTTRIIQLYIVDDRRQIQITGLRNPEELKSIITCLRLRTPAAHFGNYKEYASFIAKTEEEWQALEQAFRHAQAQKEWEDSKRERESVVTDQRFILADASGQRTSRVTPELVEEQVSSLRPGFQIYLEPLCEIRVGEQILYHANYAVDQNGAAWIFVILQNADRTYQGWGKQTDEAGGKAFLLNLLRKERIPDLSDWVPLQTQDGEPQTKQEVQNKLVLTNEKGTSREYRFFTRRDIELASQGLKDGTYRDVMMSNQLCALLFEVKQREADKAEARITVAEQGVMRMHMTKCTVSQISVWLLDCFDGKLPPDLAFWKDITAQTEKKYQKMKRKGK